MTIRALVQPSYSYFSSLTQELTSPARSELMMMMIDPELRLDATQKSSTNPRGRNHNNAVLGSLWVSHLATTSDSCRGRRSPISTHSLHKHLNIRREVIVTRWQSYSCRDQRSIQNNATRHILIYARRSSNGNRVIMSGRILPGLATPGNATAYGPGSRTIPDVTMGSLASEFDEEAAEDEQLRRQNGGGCECCFYADMTAV